MAIPRAGLDDEVDFPEVFQGRRFGAVAVPLATAIQPSTSALALADSESRSVFDLGPWSVHRVSATFPRSYFPKLNPEALRVFDGYRQEFYIALSQSLGGVALVISPYVRLLDRVLTRLSANVSAGQMNYLVPDMDEVFLRFEEAGFDFMDATRVSVKDEKEPTLDLVSLSGRNPLKSNLREELRKIGPAYAVRMAVQVKERKVNVYLDRFGNLSWYQRKESDLAAPLSAIGALLGAVKITDTLIRPTRHLSPETVEVQPENVQAP